MFKNILHSLVSKGLVAVINFLILVISSKYLGINSRGEISIFILNITIIQIINEVYTGYSLIYFIPKFDLKKIVAAGLIYTLLFCSLSNSVIIILQKQVEGFEWLGYVISLLVILNTFNCVLILGKQKIKTYNLLSFLQPFLLLVFIAVYIGWLKIFTLEAYVYPLLISFTVAWLVSTYAISKFIFKEPDKKPFELKPVLINGLLSQAGILMYIFCNRYSYYLLPGTADVGLYASASSLMEAVLIISNATSPVLMARLVDKGDHTNNINLTIALSKAVFLISILVVGLVFLIPGSFFIYLLGAGFAGIQSLMLLYAPGIILVSGFSIISNYFLATGKQKMVLVCNACGFVFTLIAAPYLIRHYGINGAAYTANGAYFCIALSMLFVFFSSGKLTVKRLFSLRKDYEDLKLLVFRERAG